MSSSVGAWCEADSRAAPAPGQASARGGRLLTMNGKHRCTWPSIPSLHAVSRHAPLQASIDDTRHTEQNNNSSNISGYN